MDWVVAGIVAWLVIAGVVLAFAMMAKQSDARYRRAVEDKDGVRWK